jgi:hypothetical protein
MGSSSTKTWLPYSDALNILTKLVHTYFDEKVEEGRGQIYSGAASKRRATQYVGYTDNRGVLHTSYVWFFIPWGGNGTRSYQIDAESSDYDWEREQIIERFQHMESISI